MQASHLHVLHCLILLVFRMLIDKASSWVAPSSMEAARFFPKRKCDAREGELHWAAHRLLRKMFDNSLHRNVREVGLFRLGKRDACDPILERIKLMVKACYIEGCPRRTWVPLVDCEEITLDTWNIKVHVCI